MRKISDTILNGGFLLAISVAACPQASAGPLVDFLLNRRTADDNRIAYSVPLTAPNTAYQPGFAANVYQPNGVYPLTPSAAAAISNDSATVRPFVAAGTPYTSGYAPTTNGYAPTTNGYAPTTNGYATAYGAGTGGFGVAVPQTVLGRLPTGSYQTALNTVPTTYYRPVTTQDPTTGAVVTTLQPCTSYQQQALRLPLLSPTTYYAAYGNYGSGLQQDRFSSVTGSSVAQASSQSSLSIPSSVGNQYITQVSQLPVNGYNVPLPGLTYQPIMQASAIAPTTSQPMIANYAAPMTANYQAYTSNLQNYQQPTYQQPNYPNTQTVDTSAGIHQADGSIITPLGPPTFSSAPAPTFNQQTNSTPAFSQQQPPMQQSPTQQALTSNFAPQSNTTQYQSQTPAPNSFRQADGSIVTPLPDNYDASGLTNSQYGNSQSNNVSSSNPALSPYSSGYDPNCNNIPLANPDLRGPMSQDVLPDNSGYLNSRPLADPESTIVPSFRPMSSNQQQSAPLALGPGRMVPIDRPAANFSPRTLQQPPSQQSARPTYVDKPLMPVPSFQSSNDVSYRNDNNAMDSTSIGAESSRASQINGMRAPKGYDARPYWRSEQPANVTPNSSPLFTNDVKTARVNQAAVQSASHVEFVNREVEREIAPAAERPRIYMTPISRDDGFSPAK